MGAEESPLPLYGVIAKPVTDSLVVAIRFPLDLYKGITDSHDQCAHWSRNDRLQGVP